MTTTQVDTDTPTTGQVRAASLHNLVGWDLLTGDGWQTIRTVRHRGTDTLVRFDGQPNTDPEWAFDSSQDVTIRPPRTAVSLDCGHAGVPARGAHTAFCWVGCFGQRAVASMGASHENYCTCGCADRFQPMEGPSIAGLHRQWLDRGLPAHTWATWLRQHQETCGSRPRPVEHAHHPSLPCHPRCARWGG